VQSTTSVASTARARRRLHTPSFVAKMAFTVRRASSRDRSRARDLVVGFCVSRASARVLLHRVANAVDRDANRERAIDRDGVDARARSERTM